MPVARAGVRLITYGRKDRQPTSSLARTAADGHRPGPEAESVFGKA